MRIIIFITGLIFCSFHPNVKETFEGTIHYKVTITSDINAPYARYQQQKYGDIQILSIDKNGNMKKKYPNSGENGIEVVTYIQKENKNYYKKRNSDTLYVTECDKPIEKLQKVEIGQGGTVLKHLCSVVLIESIVTTPAGEVPWTMEYWCTENLQVDPDLFENYLDGHWNVVTSKCAGIYLKMVIKNRGVYSTFEATRIKSEKLNKNHFQINKNSPIVKI